MQTVSKRTKHLVLSYSTTTGCYAITAFDTEGELARLPGLSRFPFPTMHLMFEEETRAVAAGMAEKYKVEIVDRITKI